MRRKVIKSGNKLVVTIPKIAIEEMEIREGTTLHAFYNRESKRLELAIDPMEKPGKNYDKEFSRQLSEFIEQYRPALRDLGK